MLSVIMRNVVLLRVMALSKTILGASNLLITLLCQDVSNRAKKVVQNCAEHKQPYYCSDMAKKVLNKFEYLMRWEFVKMRQNASILEIVSIILDSSNGTQHNDTRHYQLICDTQHKKHSA